MIKIQEYEWENRDMYKIRLNNNKSKYQEISKKNKIFTIRNLEKIWKYTMIEMRKTKNSQ